jgi:hypothetical protein
LLSGVSSCDLGGMIALHFPIFGDLPTLQDILEHSDAIDNGDVQARVESVPVPGAVALAAGHRHHSPGTT